MRFRKLLYPLLLLLGSRPWNDHVVAWIHFSYTRRSYRTVSFPVATEQDNNGDQDGSIHEYFMKLAIAQAREAAKHNEVPIGAVVVRNITDDMRQRTRTGNNRHRKERQDKEKHKSLQFEILSMGRNQVEGAWDASAHAELVAMRRAAQRLQNWRLINCTLYSTLEPCPICLSACQAFRLSRLVYGAPDLRLGAVETHIRLLDIAHPFHNVSVVERGVLRDDCADMLRSFFRARRQQGTATQGFKQNRLIGWLNRLWAWIRQR